MPWKKASHCTLDGHKFSLMRVRETLARVLDVLASLVVSSQFVLLLCEQLLISENTISGHCDVAGELQESVQPNHGQIPKMLNSVDIPKGLNSLNTSTLNFVYQRIQ